MKIPPVILCGPAQRALAMQMLREAPDGWVIRGHTPDGTVLLGVCVDEDYFTRDREERSA